MYVTLTDSEYNRNKDVIGKVGKVHYEGQTLGTLVKLCTEPYTWLYYFKGQEEFRYEAH